AVTPHYYGGGRAHTLAEHPVTIVQLLMALLLFFEALPRLVQMLVTCRLSSTLDGFVLVLELVELQLKQVGQILDIRLQPAAPLRPEADLDLAKQALAAHELLKRLLFRRQGLRWFLLSEPEGRLLHLDDRRLQVVHQFRKKRTYVQRPAPLHAVDQALRLRLQPALNQRQRFQVVRILLGIHLVLFSNQLERGADDLLLLPAQRFLRL